MDTCLASKQKGSPSEVDEACKNGQNETEECAQKIKDISQNNNAHIKTSFIPVFTKKSDACHNFPRERKEVESKTNSPEVPMSHMRNVLSSLSPPYRQKNLVDNEMLTTRTRSHMRRHSVGFEDITSATYCFGRNFTNDKRYQTVTHNPNSSPPSSVGNSSPKSFNEPIVKTCQGIQDAMIPANQNSKLSSAGNENDSLFLENDKPLLQRFEKLKDKSFKRKSSLNRIDFIHMPIPPKDKMCSKIEKCDREHKNSSSDENVDSRPLQKPSLTLSKRKHSSSPVAGQNTWERKENNVAPQHEGAASSLRSKLLPRFNPLKLKNRKINYSNAHHFEKLSYSAGELESLTSENSNNGKICLSAQEFDGRDNPRAAFKNYKKDDNPFRICSQVPTGKAFHKNTSKNSGSVAKMCDTASQNCAETAINSCHSVASKDANEQKSSVQHELGFYGRYDNVPLVCEKDSSCADGSLFVREIVNDRENCVIEENEISLGHTKAFNTESQDKEDIDNNTSKIQCLEISTSLECPELEDNEELLGSDAERRPSILRKTYLEGRRELHGILKPTPDEKLSRTPPSILKHRESSEEKDWPQSDLHSILKKSTSEDESYNSNPDIRPILKNVSTDEESSGGTVRPRPILKKRTSFSEECSYACYASGELKPILKKKSLSNSEDQPKPILKTRRKSEDARTTMEFVTGARPRAYSADMGVKSNHEMRINNSSLDFERKDLTSQKCDHNDL